MDFIILDSVTGEVIDPEDLEPGDYMARVQGVRIYPSGSPRLIVIVTRMENMPEPATVEPASDDEQ